jgi:8-oxo-dGTP pyrophosphatase MutT (NUDIX family)
MNIKCKKGCCTLKVSNIQVLKNKLTLNPFEKRKAGVFVYCENKVLLTQSYNNYWGIPKGQMEQYDFTPKNCAERELKEETGLSVTLMDEHLYKILFDNCYIYKIKLANMAIVNLNNLDNFDSTGIGWVNFECAFDLQLNFITKTILMSYIT